MRKPIKIGSSDDARAAVRQLRERAGMTQRQVAEVTGIDQGQLCRTEAAGDMRVSTMLSLAGSLGYEVVLREKAGPPLADLVERALSEFRLSCFDNVDVANLPRDADTARFAVRCLEHMGGRKGFMLACQMRRILADLEMDGHDAA